MAITKTNFINYVRCPRYVALAEIKKEKLDADISFHNHYFREPILQKILVQKGGTSQHRALSKLQVTALRNPA